MCGDHDLCFSLYRITEYFTNLILLLNDYYFPRIASSVRASLKWLSYVPAAGGPDGVLNSVCAVPRLLGGVDPVDRPVMWSPSPTPYDPRMLFTGEVDEATGEWTSGTCTISSSLITEYFTIIMLLLIK